MTYTPTTQQLRGLPVEVAECYGKPHIRAHYDGAGVKSHKLDEGATCATCPRLATNVHHCPPISKGKTFLLRSEWGAFDLKPALFALCGSGTTGCHNGFHGGARFKAVWVWDTDEFAKRWWSGWLLSHGIEPHSEQLYDMGSWKITDRLLGSRFEVRL